jgi:hypothetical protein
MTTEYLDAPRPPPGWHVLGVVRETSRKWDWVALLIDVDPDDFVNHRPGTHSTRHRWFRIPGKHATREAAWDALDDAMATRH